MGNFSDIIVLLAASVAVVALFGRLRLPPILAYLYVGLAVGPHGLGLVSETENVHFLAEFGVVFLLFTIGLEFSLPRLIAMKWIVLGLGGAQVILGTVIIIFISWLFELSLIEGFILGGTLVMSSTALVVKQLNDQGELNARHGQTALGVLLFQDMAVVPFLILIPIFANDTGGSMAEPLLLALMRGATVFLLMLIVGRILLRPLFHEIAVTQSTELFTLTVLLVIILAAWTTHLADLSLALGAFLAGMMLGETEFRHQIESDIRPFQDVLLGLFFITIGMLINIDSVKEHWLLIVALGIVIIIGKAALVVLLLHFSEGSRRDALRSGLILAQGGEFGFALISLALASDLLQIEASQVVLAAILLSMIISPFIIRYNGAIAGWFAEKLNFGQARKAHRSVSEFSVVESGRYLKDHAIILGYGLTGQNLARILELEGIPYIASDLDPERVRQARAAGETVVYGDASRHEILEVLGINHAKLVVITIDHPNHVVKVLQNIRNIRQEIPICVRSKDDFYLDKYQREGADEIIPENLEASLMLTSHCLPLMDVPMSRVIRYTREARKDNYRMLRGFFHGQNRQMFEPAGRFREQLCTVAISENAYGVEKTLGELGLDDINVSVTSIRRQNIRVPDPTLDVKLKSGDVLVLFGVAEDLEKAESILLGGTI